ncbi:peptidylprolyl isomerase [Sphingobium nicotianae]|uniref:peptidylprolyl isomerase n=1 Tax=Sphingobium nicotianae TaxID=2782607 RepID=A0A9X1DFN2_9SPHN|nr:peptidylprolyl isomerase [Sphingobium nicotianae]MBT2188658.1 peptidylprolyl isomerase [Sphingobium nicotianae]
MKPALLLPVLLAAAAASGLAIAQPVKPAAKPSPGEIVAAAPAGDWVDIAPDDLLVMTLAPDAGGKPRAVVIQLMPAPFSQGWVGNIKTIARAHWWDGTSVYRVQDNYVAQWGEPDDASAKAKSLPATLRMMPESDYAVAGVVRNELAAPRVTDAYGAGGFSRGWPFAIGKAQAWPVHCYGAVGVARDMSPNTGTGSELYAVIGHAPRHLDRNIAVVGRIIEGIEHLSSLPRGPAPLGFYDKAEERTPILSVRLASETPATEQPHFQYLATASQSFAKYAEARANRRDPFFLVPAGGADLCNIPVPIRRKP